MEIIIVNAKKKKHFIMGIPRKPPKKNFLIANLRSKSAHTKEYKIKKLGHLLVMVRGLGQIWMNFEVILEVKKVKNSISLSFKVKSMSIFEDLLWILAAGRRT